MIIYYSGCLAALFIAAFILFKERTTFEEISEEPITSIIIFLSIVIITFGSWLSVFLIIRRDK